ncbi:MAG: transposase [Deltaproteobacteria bacterium]|nr:transposase [Deltaproteobacteria bacterium]
MALEGDLSEKRRVTLMIALDDIRRLETIIAELDRHLLSTLKPYQKEFDPLQTIPGLAVTGAALHLARIGPDLGAFKTAERLPSWAGLALVTMSSR